MGSEQSIEQAEDLLVSYPCVYDPGQRRIMAMDDMGRQYDRYMRIIQPLLWVPERVRTV
jgi:hypothetical protein